MQISWKTWPQWSFLPEPNPSKQTVHSRPLPVTTVGIWLTMDTPSEVDFSGIVKAKSRSNNSSMAVNTTSSRRRKFDVNRQFLDFFLVSKKGDSELLFITP
ncbi:proliferating cell nuclear antigen, partial [Striga asiatica]